MQIGMKSFIFIYCLYGCLNEIQKDLFTFLKEIKYSFVENVCLRRKCRQRKSSYGTCGKELNEI